MRQLIFLFTLLPLLSTAQDITGQWKTFDDKTKEATSVIEIFHHNGNISGKVAEILDPEDRNSTCKKCPGDDKGKPILGMVIIKNLKKKGDVYKGGTILDPSSGRVYKVQLSLEEPDLLKIRGYLGVSMLGRTQYWQRIH